MTANPIPPKTWRVPERDVRRRVCCAILAGVTSFVAASALQTITSPAMAGGETPGWSIPGPSPAVDGVRNGRH